ncbi:hypothetical protein DFH09DRAFT_1104845 [Mycena vulgaris]|nr:hypothetical protein DFH09DRAFT_1104845 [Mycena vulgaris]
MPTETMDTDAVTAGIATTPVTVKNAQANGLNERVEIQATAGKLFWPIPLTTPIECNGIYTVRASSTFAPTPVPFGLDCTSREVSIVALNPQVCAVPQGSQTHLPWRTRCFGIQLLGDVGYVTI